MYIFYCIISLSFITWFSPYKALCNAANQVSWINPGAVTSSENSQNLNNLWDNNINNTWRSTSGTATFHIQMPSDSLLAVNGFLIGISHISHQPKSWKIWGSSDNNSFIHLGEGVFQTIEDTQRIRVYMPNEVYYPHIKLELFDNNDFSDGETHLEMGSLFLTVAGKTETFELLDIGPGIRHDGQYVGDHGITWSYTNSRDGQNFGAENRSLMMRGQESATLSTEVFDGISFISFDYTEAFTTNKEPYFLVRTHNLQTNIIRQLVTTPPVGDTNVNGVQTIFIDSINEPGHIRLEIIAQHGPVCIDNVGILPFYSDSIITVKQARKFVPAKINPKHPFGARQTHVLNGTFYYKHDTHSEGQIKQWYKPENANFTDPFTVPGTIQSNGYTHNFFNASTRWRFVQDQTSHFTNSWYRKDFVTPDYNPDNQLVWLGIGGIHPACRIWINGTFATSHFSADIPFACDISKLLNPPGETNTMVIEIVEDLEARVLAGHFNKNTYWSGIFRNVELQVSNKVLLEHLQIHTDNHSKTVHTRLKLYADTIEFSGSIEINIENSEHVVETFRYDIAISKGETELNFHSELSGDLNLWFPESPELYTCEIVIYDQHDKVLDSYKEDFGFRDLMVSGPNMFINDKYLYLRGAGDLNLFPETGCPPIDREYYRDNLRKLKSLGFNKVRHHSFTPVDEYLDVANEEGFLVQVEASVVGQWTRHQTLPSKKYVWENTLMRCGNHPSVIIFCMGNEGGRTDYQADFYQFAKQNHFAQFIIATAHHENVHTNRYSDIIETNTNYADKPYFRHEYTHSSSTHDISYYDHYKGMVPESGKSIWFMENMLSNAQKNEIDHRIKDFYTYSVLFQNMNRKSSIEFFRQKHKFNNGYNLWVGSDSEYAMGLINNHNQIKKGVDTEDIKKFNQEIILLNTNDVGSANQGGNNFYGVHEVNLRKRILNVGQPLVTSIEISNKGYDPIENKTIAYELRDVITRELISREERTGIFCEPGSFVPGIEVQVQLPEVQSPQRLILTASLETNGKTYLNDWYYMIYPETHHITARVYLDESLGESTIKRIQDDYKGLTIMDTESQLDHTTILVTSTLNGKVRRHLLEGGNVLLLAKGLFSEFYIDLGNETRRRQSKYATFLMGSNYFNARHIFGNIINNPLAFGKDFPFSDQEHPFMDIVFANCLWDAPVMNLTEMGMTHSVDNLVECIPYFNNPQSLSYMFQTSTEGGNLLATTLSIEGGDDPDTRYVLGSLIGYVNGDDFKPAENMQVNELFEMHYQVVGYPQNNVMLTQSHQGNVSLFDGANDQLLNFETTIPFRSSLYAIATPPQSFTLDTIYSNAPVFDFDKDNSRYDFVVEDNPVHLHVVYKDIESNINDEAVYREINIYPHITTGSFSIQNDGGRLLALRIYDVFGRDKIGLHMVQGGDEIHIADLPAGIYTVVLSHQEFSKSIKLLKL